MSYRHLLTLLGVVLVILGLVKRGWFLMAVWLGCDFLSLGVAHGRGSHRVFGKRPDGTLPRWSPSRHSLEQRAAQLHSRLCTEHGLTNRVGRRIDLPPPAPPGKAASFEGSIGAVARVNALQLAHPNQYRLGYVVEHDGSSKALHSGHRSVAERGLLSREGRAVPSASASRHPPTPDTPSASDGVGPPSSSQETTALLCPRACR